MYTCGRNAQDPWSAPHAPLQHIKMSPPMSLNSRESHSVIEENPVNSSAELTYESDESNHVVPFSHPSSLSSPRLSEVSSVDHAEEMMLFSESKKLWELGLPTKAQLGVPIKNSSEEFSTPPPPPKPVAPGSASKTKGLYKTELCRQWEETRSCKYGSKCQFAHGLMELRESLKHPKYKTMECRSFHTTGSCSYGRRCRFLHVRPNEIENLTKVMSVNISTLAEEGVLSKCDWDCPSTVEGRLSVFAGLV